MAAPEAVPQTRASLPRNVRLLAFAGFAVLALVYLGVAISPLPSGLRTGVLGVLYLLPAAAAFGAALRVARRTSGKERRLWRVLCAVIAFFLAGDMYWTLYQAAVSPSGPKGLSVADVAYGLAFLGLVPVALLMTESFEVVRLRKLRSTLDLAAMVLWALVIVRVFVVKPTMHGGSLTLDMTADTAYFVAAIGFLLYLVTFKRAGWTSWDLLIATSMVFLATSGAVHLFLLDVYASGDLRSAVVDLGWMSAYAAMGMAAVFRLSGDTVPPQRFQKPSLDLPHWPGTVAHLMALAGIPYFTFLATRPEYSGADSLALASMAAGVGVLVVLRSAVVTLENRELASRSLIDPLTGAFNHRHFHERLRAECEQAVRDGAHVSVAILDLVDFEAVNRVLGHTSGDLILQTVASNLERAVRTVDTVARVGGDSFGVIMPGTDAAECYVVCLRLQQTLGVLGTRELPARMSVGVATLPTHAGDALETLRKAESALYWARSEKPGAIAIYDPETVRAHDPREHIAQLEERSHTAMVEALAAAVDARDPYTQFHSRNVAALAVDVAAAVGLDEARIPLLESAALLHDVGKIGVPDSVLRKTGPLTSDEFLLVREHPMLGSRILSTSTRQEILPWVLSHHERWDGTGYPRGLSAEDIPREARILALCDAYDAMTSDRPYRTAMSAEEALLEVRIGSGTQFDPDMVPAFCETVLRRSHEH